VRPTNGDSSSSDFELITRPPAQTVVRVGGLRGGLDVEAILLGTGPSGVIFS
jgi:hypothetical protein